MNKKNVKFNTETDYNKISAQFASTRHYQWPEMALFVKHIKSDWNILDVGCGNGRLLESLKEKKINYTGIDSSKELIKIARKKYKEEKFEIMDMEKLDFPDKTFDAAFSIASLHHLPTKDLRREALRETRRVLKKEGYLFITVWNLWQPKYRKYIWKNYFNMVFKKSKTHFGDTFIPWKDSDQNVLTERYYFAYTLNILKRDLESSGFEIKEIAHSKWNIYAIAQK